MEELFENLIWVVTEAIAALEFPVGVEALLEFFPSILIVEGPLDGVAQDFEGLRHF